MNYYEHHLGDYAEATAHLSFLEDAAYSRLIRKYYASEKPIPADLAAAQRLIGARSKDERAAVEVVLREFFVLSDDGWHQERCDAEIARYQDKQDKAKRSANARWGKPTAHDDCNANAMRTHSGGNAHQTPDTRHQSPDPKQRQQEKELRVPRATSPKKTAIPDDFEVSERVLQWAGSKGHARLPDRLEHFRSACKAKGYTYADWDEAFMAAIRDDWAKFSSQPAGRPGAASRSERNAKAMQEFLDDSSPNPFAGQQSDRLTIDG